MIGAMIQLVCVLSVVHFYPKDYCYVTVEATAYCGGPCRVCGTSGTTKTGRDASLDGIAVDPTVIPIGSRIDYPREKGSDRKCTWVLADDTGGAIRGRRIDIRMGHAEAVEFGRKQMVIRVWRKK